MRRQKLSYGSRTYNSLNPLVRLAHRARLERALRLVPPVSGLLLDYGCGDGTFGTKLSERLGTDSIVIGYEPYMELSKDCKIEVCRTWKEVEIKCTELGPPMVITCFEVLEHFSADTQAETLKRMYKILPSNGWLIVSVPVEVGVVSLLKNLFRRAQYGGHSLYSWRNILKSILHIQIPEARRGGEYLSHMGFYYTDLERIIASIFEIDDRVCSPFSQLGPRLNSQEFYLGRRK